MQGDYALYDVWLHLKKHTAFVTPGGVPIGALPERFTGVGEVRVRNGANALRVFETFFHAHGVEIAHVTRDGGNYWFTLVGNWTASANPPEVAEPCTIDSDETRIARALDIASRHGSTGEEHHLHWVVDQMVRALTGKDYAAWVKEHCSDGHDPNAYEWDCGIPP